MADRFKAAIDDVFTFDCETIDDSFEKSIARHEFPFRDGALLEDMGQKARVVKIRCYFLNENYETHKSLINYIGMTGHEYELTHPKYGLIKGQIETMVVRHDDRLETAEIDLTFVENLRGLIDAVFAPPVDAGTEEAFIRGQDELTDEMTADIREELGTDADDLLSADLNQTLPTLFEQFSGLTKNAQAYVKKVDQYVARLRATLTEIASPANSLVSTISYAANLPGVVIGSLAGAVERYALLCESLRSAPNRFLRNFKVGIEELEDAFGDFRKYTRTAKAQRAAVELGVMFKADQTRSRMQQQSAAVRSFSPLGRPQKSIGAPDNILSIIEIEQALAIVRTDLQAAIDLSRAMQSLKTMAAALTDHVIEIKKTKPPIIRVSIDGSMPLHLICLRYGLSYNDAEQLMAINRIRHPSFMSGEVNVYAR